MLREGLYVTVNSDDPAYFGGYVADNYSAMRNGSPKLGEQMTHRSLIWRIRWLHFKDTMPSLRMRNGRKHTAATQGKKKIFVGPGESAPLPVLDMVHKITADRSCASLTVEE
jgi:hypothetical protein